MTTNLLVLQFLDEGKLTVDEAVQLLETLAEETEEQEIVWEMVPAQTTMWIVLKNCLTA